MFLKGRFTVGLLGRNSGAPVGLVLRARGSPGGAGHSMPPLPSRTSVLTSALAGPCGEEGGRLGVGPGLGTAWLFGKQ